MKNSLVVSMAVLVAVCFSVRSATAQNNEQVLGIGFGIPYGALGVNYEIGINQYAAGTVGLGFAIEGVGWFAGGRLYYPVSAKLRTRLTAGYGVTAVVTGSENGTRTGFAIGPGLDWRYGEKWSFQADVLFATFDVHEGEHGDDSGVKIALGFARRW